MPWSWRNLSGWELPLLILLLFLGFAFWLVPAQCRSGRTVGLREGSAVGGGCTLLNLPRELAGVTYHGCPVAPVGSSASIRNAGQIEVLFAVLEANGSCGLEGAMATGGMARVGGPQFSLECAPNSSTPLVLMAEPSPRNVAARVRQLCGGTCKAAFYGTRTREVCEEESYWATWLGFGVLVSLFLLLALYVHLRGRGFCAGPICCCCWGGCCWEYCSDDESGDEPSYNPREWYSHDRRRGGARYGARVLPPRHGLGHSWRRDVRRTLHTVRDIEQPTCAADHLRKRWYQHGSEPSGARGSSAAAAGGKTAAAALCAICLVEDEPEEAVLVHEVLPCGHVFHAHCIQHWRSVSSSCPLCREAMRAAHVFMRTATVREI